MNYNKPMAVDYTLMVQRFPRELRKRVREEAGRRDMTIREFVIWLISEYIDKK